MFYNTVFENRSKKVSYLNFPAKIVSLFLARKFKLPTFFNLDLFFAFFKMRLFDLFSTTVIFVCFFVYFVLSVSFLNVFLSLQKISDWLRRKVGQIVVVVIDALRADFVLPEATLEAELGLKRLQPSKMKYLHNALRKNDDDEKIAFLSRANAPTVTMPRLKVRSNQVQLHSSSSDPEEGFYATFDINSA